MQGKTGRHDLIIQELKDQYVIVHVDGTCYCIFEPLCIDRLLQHEILVRQQEARIHELQANIEELEELNQQVHCPLLYFQCTTEIITFFSCSNSLLPQ